MVEEYTVNLIDTSGSEPTVTRTNSYDDLNEALDAVAVLSEFITFEEEQIELVGDGSELVKTPHYWTPSVGGVMEDPEAPHWSTGRVHITEVTDTPASDYDLEYDGFATGHEQQKTVAQENPSEPEDAPVVLGEYQRTSGKKSKEYAFPVTRLEKV